MKYKCELCKLNYETYNGLWKHNKKYHSTNNKPNDKSYKSSDKPLDKPPTKSYKCSKCDNVFIHYQSRWKHEKKCNNIKPEKNQELQLIKSKLEQLEKIIDDEHNQSNPVNNQLINIIMDKNKTIEELNTKITNTTEIIPIKNDGIIEPGSLTLNNVVIISRVEDNYINATQLCQAGGKKFNDWYRLETTKELINELASDVGISVSQSLITNKNETAPKAVIPVLGAYSLIEINKCYDKNETTNDAGIPVSLTYSLIEINKGGNKYNQETWVHPQLAIQLAQWISPKFALQVSKWILHLFSNGKVEINMKLIKEKENEIRLKDMKIQLLQDQFQKKQQRKDYPEKNVIYILTTEDNKKKRIYIIGKANKLKNRLSSYNKTAEHEVVYYKECKGDEDMNLAELMVLNKLKEYKEKANRDRFILPQEKDISFFTSIIDKSIEFFN